MSVTSHASIHVLTEAAAVEFNPKTYPSLKIRVDGAGISAFTISLTGSEEERVRFAHDLTAAALAIADWQPEEEELGALHADCGTRHRIGQCPAPSNVIV